MAFENQRKTGQTILYKQGDLKSPEASITDNLPHIRSIKSGINKWDPVHSSIFEVSFTVPPLIQNEFMGILPILQQQVVNVSGLDALQKTTSAGTQKFYGVDVSYLNPTLESGTFADLTITFNLNLKDVTDNFVLRLFRAWENISYDLADGTRSIKSDYCASQMVIAQGNRNGDVWRSVAFKDVMLTGVTNLDTLDYSSNEALTLQCTFRSDYWYDTLATGNGGNNQ